MYRKPELLKLLVVALWEVVALYDRVNIGEIANVEGDGGASFQNRLVLLDPVGFYVLQTTQFREYDDVLINKLQYVIDSLP